MFRKILSVVIIGEGQLAKQTSLLGNRWVNITTLKPENIHATFDAASYDLVLICLENTNDIECDTKEVGFLLERLESQSSAPLHNVIVRSIITPGSASRMGVHIWNSFEEGQFISNFKFWIFGRNLACGNHGVVIVDSLTQLLVSAFEWGTLETRPKLDVVSLAEAETTLFGREALLALRYQFTREMQTYMAGQNLDSEKILAGLEKMLPKNSPSTIDNSRLESWLGSMSEHARSFPLLTHLNGLLFK